MPEKPKVGCARPTGGVVGQPQKTEKQPLPPDEKEVTKMIHVGKPAPDCVAPAYHKGDFTSVKLSGLVGKVWEVWKTEMEAD